MLQKQRVSPAASAISPRVLGGASPTGPIDRIGLREPTFCRRRQALTVSLPADGRKLRLLRQGSSPDHAGAFVPATAHRSAAGSLGRRRGRRDGGPRQRTLPGKSKDRGDQPSAEASDHGRSLGAFASNAWRHGLVRGEGRGRRGDVTSAATTLGRRRGPPSSRNRRSGGCRGQIDLPTFAQSAVDRRVKLGKGAAGIDSRCEDSSGFPDGALARSENRVTLSAERTPPL